MNNSKIIVGVVGAVVISIVALVGAFTGQQATPTDPNAQVGGQRAGSQVFQDGATLGDNTIKYVRGTIAAADGLSQANWRNTTGKNVYVDLVEIRTSGAVASSSAYILDVGTSTASTISYSGTVYTDSYGTLIDGFALASSTPTNTVISNIGSGLARRQVIQVPADTYVNITFVAPELCNDGPGQHCYSATSTIRGFDLDWVIRYNYKP